MCALWESLRETPWEKSGEHHRYLIRGPASVTLLPLWKEMPRCGGLTWEGEMPQACQLKSWFDLNRARCRPGISEEKNSKAGGARELAFPGPPKQDSQGPDRRALRGRQGLPTGRG